MKNGVWLERVSRGVGLWVMMLEAGIAEFLRFSGCFVTSVPS